ncbi:hypothetical protein GGQ68_002526 [Sagittula marina]|uniref:Transmembrane protein n=1 Tax=Sagittula marina TaxID=943940 RepID=A0A7W6DU89_9RHOB|nr:hypothetical protein [Sagittula marina]MBB3986188.1 hypothetical protein [Sagittula marina]
MTVEALLDFIAKPESGNDPNIVWAGIKAKHRPPRPLTTMTVQEVLDWQDSIDPLYMSEAAGEWQFMEDTLRGLYREAGVSLRDTFDEATQYRLAYALLRRRGLDDYLEGHITAEAFAQNLSKEWASLPCITVDRNGRAASGQSYYAGDGLNKAHVSREDLLRHVRALKSRPIFSHPMPPAPEPAVIPAEVKEMIEDGRKGWAQSATIRNALKQAIGGPLLAVGAWFAAQPGHVQIGAAVALSAGAAAILWGAWRVISERRRKAHAAEKAARAVDPTPDAAAILSDPRVLAALQALAR